MLQNWCKYAAENGLPRFCNTIAPFVARDGFLKNTYEVKLLRRNCRYVAAVETDVATDNVAAVAAGLNRMGI
jgi:hypothetical protein